MLLHLFINFVLSKALSQPPFECFSQESNCFKEHALSMTNRHVFIFILASHLALLLSGSCQCHSGKHHQESGTLAGRLQTPIPCSLSMQVNIEVKVQ